MRSTSGLYVGAGVLTNYVIGKRGILKIIQAVQMYNHGRHNIIK